MRRKPNLIIKLLCLFAVVFASCNNAERTAEPMLVIMDTDMGNGVDDVMALQQLLDYEREGRVRLLGITVGKAHPRSVEYVDAYCRLNGKEDVLLGYAYNGVNPEAGNYLCQTLDTLIDGEPVLQPHQRLTDGMPEGYVLMRRLLSEQEDGSVVLFALGPLTNLARLLASGADEYCPLSGRELVRRKVRLLALMGGNYDQAAKRPEWNLRQDIESAHKVFAEWHTPIVASGFEVGAQFICTKEQIRNAFSQGESHPLYISFCLASKVSHYHGATWDATIVHHVMNPDDDAFTLSPSGIITVNADGSTLFTPSAEGQHRYLIPHRPAPEFLP